MRRFLVLGVVGTLLLIACSEDSHVNLLIVDDVVSTLDRHTLTNRVDVNYQIIAAFDGAGYDVSPGEYRVEIYTYLGESNIPPLATAETLDSQVHVEGNVLLILHTPEKQNLDRLVADLRDG